MGNAFYSMGELDSARTYLQKSLTVNPLDFQAHYYLADIYNQQGELDSARASILRALVLNQGNLNIMVAAENILGEKGEEINFKRLRFGFALSFAKDSVALEFADSAASSLVLASCLVAWEREDLFRPLRERDDPLGQMRLRHCLVNQALMAQQLYEMGYPLDDGSFYLLRVFNAGLLSPMILWEVLSGPYPHVAYLVSDSEREGMFEYLDRFVVRKVRR